MKNYIGAEFKYVGSNFLVADDSRFHLYETEADASEGKHMSAERMRELYFAAPVLIFDPVANLFMNVVTAEFEYDQDTGKATTAVFHCIDKSNGLINVGLKYYTDADYDPGE